MTIVALGNRHASDSTDNGATRQALPKGKRATVIQIPDDIAMSHAFLAITTPGGVWDTHTATTDPETGATVSGDHKPAWVASDDPALASVISAHFGGIEIRDLEENDR